MLWCLRAQHGGEERAKAKGDPASLARVHRSSIPSAAGLQRAMNKGGIGVAITITAEMSAALEGRAGSSLQENTGEV